MCLQDTVFPHDSHRVVSRDQHVVIEGGITNLLWKVVPPEESGLGPVVVRVFGEETNRLIDRARELRILLQLNEAGFGARVRSCTFSEHLAFQLSRTDMQKFCNTPVCKQSEISTEQQSSVAWEGS